MLRVCLGFSEKVVWSRKPCARIDAVIRVSLMERYFRCNFLLWCRLLVHLNKYMKVLTAVANLTAFKANIADSCAKVIDAKTQLLRNLPSENIL